MIALPVGFDAVLLECSLDDDDPTAEYRRLLAARERGDLDCVELVPAARTVLIAGLADPQATLRALPSWPYVAPTSSTEAESITIPVTWDGPDLAEVARAWAAQPSEVLRETAFTVAFCGFAPGFGYLTGLPERLFLPRLPTPRTGVPAGSVATAGPYVGIYPHATPGGWRLLGRTDAVLFDPDRTPPTLFTPGARVRFIDA